MLGISNSFKLRFLPIVPVLENVGTQSGMPIPANELVIAAYSFIDLLRDIWQAKHVMHVRQSLGHLSPSKIRQLLRNVQDAS